MTGQRVLWLSLFLGVSVRTFATDTSIWMVESESRLPSPMWVGLIQSTRAQRTQVRRRRSSLLLPCFYWSGLSQSSTFSQIGIYATGCPDSQAFGVLTEWHQLSWVLPCKCLHNHVSHFLIVNLHYERCVLFLWRTLTNTICILLFRLWDSMIRYIYRKQMF